MKRKYALVTSFVVVASLLLGSLLVAAQQGEPAGGVGDYEARIAELEAQLIDLTIQSGTNRELLDFLEEQWIPGPQGEQGPVGPQGEKGDTGDPGIGFGMNGTVIITGAEFEPQHSSDNIQNLGYAIINDGPSWAVCYAQVQLPHGSNITKITAIWDDEVEATDMDCFLYRNRADPDNWVNEWIVYFNSTGPIEGIKKTSTTSISAPEVDSNQYAYYLKIGLPPPAIGGLDDHTLYQVLIEYEYPE